MQEVSRGACVGFCRAGVDGAWVQAGLAWLTWAGRCALHGLGCGDAPVCCFPPQLTHLPTACLPPSARSLRSGNTCNGVGGCTCPRNKPDQCGKPGVCTDKMTDKNNCGFCGNKCKGNKSELSAR